MKFFAGLCTLNASDRLIEAKRLCEYFSELDFSSVELQQYLPTLVRLSQQCPDTRVKESFVALITDLRDRNYRVPLSNSKEPSHFFDLSDAGLSSLTNKSTLSQRVSARNGYEEDYVGRILMSTFLQNLRVSNMVSVFALVPSYLECFLTTFTRIMLEPGPLPGSWRHYIAMLACSRYECRYLFNLQLIDFKWNDGDPSWLESFANAPKKIQNLVEINRFLAHQPWKINTTHIHFLLKGTRSSTYHSPLIGSSIGSQGIDDTWSLSEISHVISIMSIFHTLCGFIYGCGISPEPDFTEGHHYPTSLSAQTTQSTTIPDTILPTSNPPTSDKLDRSVKKKSEFSFLAAMGLGRRGNGAEVDQTPINNNTTNTNTNNNNNNTSGPGKSSWFVAISELLKNTSAPYNMVNNSAMVTEPQSSSKLEEQRDEFDSVINSIDYFILAENDSVENVTGSGTGTLDDQGISTNGGSVFSQSAGDYPLSMGHLSSFFTPYGGSGINEKALPTRHVDYNVKEMNHKFLKVQDFSWSDHCYCQLSTYYTTAADCFDTEFRLINDMTDNSMGDIALAVDTTKIRQAIWYYIQRLYGVWHDDYDYSEVNKYLEIPLKQYIKKVACYPTSIAKRDFVDFGLGLRPLDKAHIAILALESKRQAELLYFFNILDNYLANK